MKTVEEIRGELNSDDWLIRVDAMQACIDRTDIPIYLIGRGLDDEDVCVRHAALRACECRKDIPPELIKRCENDEQMLRLKRWLVK